MNDETMNKKGKSSFWHHLEQTLTSDDIFHETEVQATRLGALILLCSGIVLILVMFLTILGVFPMMWDAVHSSSVPALIEIAILLAVCRAARYDAWWLKYLLMFGLVIIYARLDSMLTHKAAILMVLPVVFSSRYFSRRLTIFTSLLTTAAFFLSAIYGAVHGMINLNIVTMPKGTIFIATGGFLGEAVRNAGVSNEMLIRNTLLYDYLPKWLMFSIAAIISSNIARRGRDMVITRHEEDMKTERMKSELDLAARIQAAMLPEDSQEIPSRPEFDICGAMDPAREVGGDFYDYFLVDDDHLCMVIADVSGKGIPAALFMMISKTLLKNQLMSGCDPATALERVNDQLYERNSSMMFVTVWLAVLEISTGKGIAANAGHENPALRRSGKDFEMLKYKHGMVVGVRKSAQYENREFELSPGDTIFVYTDGVPEATNDDMKLFGEERLLKTLNRDADAAPTELCRRMLKAVDDYAGDAPQFDDITMLSIKYCGPQNQEEKPE